MNKVRGWSPRHGSVSWVALHGESPCKFACIKTRQHNAQTSNRSLLTQRLQLPCRPPSPPTVVDALRICMHSEVHVPGFLNDPSFRCLAVCACCAKQHGNNKGLVRTDLAGGCVVWGALRGIHGTHTAYRIVQDREFVVCSIAYPHTDAVERLCEFVWLLTCMLLFVVWKIIGLGTNYSASPTTPIRYNTSLNSGTPNWVSENALCFGYVALCFGCVCCACNAEWALCSD